MHFAIYGTLNFVLDIVECNFVLSNCLIYFENKAVVKPQKITNETIKGQLRP